MGVKVKLPPGCSGIDAQDGTRYTGRKGGVVEVSDTHAAAIRRSQHQDIGMLSGTEAHFIGTKKGRWCEPCKRLWNAWSTECPKCGVPTTEEG